MANFKLIFKNTLFLYCRQILVLFVALFTTRIVIRTLGVEDYGLYNLIAGVITLLNILTASMTLATQRFLSMSIGTDDGKEFQRVYDTCNTIYLGLCVIVFIVGEVAGVLFLNTLLSIPEGRMDAANWCYQFALISFMLGIMRIPSNSVIIAYEKMDFYAYVSILEVLILLCVAYTLLMIPYDHLITYSVLTTGTALLVNIVYILYCRINLHVWFKKISFRNDDMSRILSFSFWTLLGSIATIGTKQGINILLNVFFGVRLNAASAVATKVSANSYSFISNFTTAYRPQIFKLYASKSYNELNQLIYRTTKLSSFLYSLILIPISLYLDNLLFLWLGTPPEYSSVFCRLLLLYLLVDTIQYPLISLVHAIGNIRNFQIVLSSLLILNLPVMWIMLRYGYPVEYIYYCYIAFNVITSIYRVIYIKKRTTLDIRTYILLTIRILLTLLVSYFICYIVKEMLDINNNWIGLLENSVVSLIVTSFIIFMIGLSHNEQKKIVGTLRERINHTLLKTKNKRHE